MSIIESARALAAQEPLCDACLGRVFANQSFGLTNAERGKSLRIAVSLADDTPHEPVDTTACWVCEGACAEEQFDSWAQRCATAVTDTEFNTYQVGTKTPPLIEENETLLRESIGLQSDAGELFKSEHNREVGKRIGQITEKTVEFGRPDIQFTIDLAADSVNVDIHSAFVYGRYRKLERGIPQTEWPCSACDGSGYQGNLACETCGGSGYLYDESVEELTAPVVCDVMDGTDATFHGAGREDVDALMIGTGRPFVIEVFEPRRRNIDTDRLEGDINAFADGAVEVEKLRVTNHEMVERVKELEASKRYRADIVFDTPVDVTDFDAALTALTGATIEQYTPNRVDHRRAAITRTRTVYDADGTIEDPTHATVEIHGAGGLYVKELISGDDGRTEPSLAGLLETGATVTDLDVLGVYAESESESFEDDTYFRTVDASS
jgi:TIGR01213 family protein